MQLYNTPLLLLLVTTLTQLSQTAPAPTNPLNGTDLVPVYTRPLAGGILTYYAPPSSAPSAFSFDWDQSWGHPSLLPAPPHPSVANTLARRCGSNAIHCSTTNQAVTSVCQTLVNSLHDNAGVYIPNTVQSVSWSGGDDGQCFIRWTAQVSGLYQGYLGSAADKTLSQCGGATWVSGWASDVNLNGVCVNQCMSNRDSC